MGNKGSRQSRHNSFQLDKPTKRKSSKHSLNAGKHSSAKLRIRSRSVHDNKLDENLSFSSRIHGATIFGSEKSFSISDLGFIDASGMASQSDMMKDDEKNNLASRPEKVASRHHRAKTGTFTTFGSGFEGDVYTLPVYLMDGAALAVKYSELDTIKHVTIRIAEKHGLKHNGDYSLFLVTNGLVSGDVCALDDEVNFKSLIQQWKPSQMLKDDLFTGSTKSLSKSRELKRSDSKHIMLRRRVFFKESYASHEVLLSQDCTSMAFTLAFMDARFNFRSGFLHQSRAQLIEVSSLLYQSTYLQLRGEVLQDISDGKALKAFDLDILVNEVLPSPVLASLDGEEIDELIAEMKTFWKRAGICSMTSFDVEQIFCQKLSSSIPWYGSIVFHCTVGMDSTISGPKFLAIAEGGVYLFERAAECVDGVVEIWCLEWPRIIDWSTSEETVGRLDIQFSVDDNVETHTLILQKETTFSVVDQLIEYAHLAKLGGAMDRSE